MRWPQFLRRIDATAKQAALARAELRNDRLRREAAQLRRDLLRKTIEASRGAKQTDG
ncbi:hypothetical protein MACH17_18760 [Phaeobacter inhibens]|uniref:hypothetical protein n=1 Tax=Phaeobacter inhibens TaxID=221822 RepID=UPI00276AD43C|nr:hypothetical protein [Phaeobacter inhibens]GLO70359.1 hypothetical protein MACH17_18760 [Phaeobacter inhibens]